MVCGEVDAVKWGQVCSIYSGLTAAGTVACQPHLLRRRCAHPWSFPERSDTVHLMWSKC
jgi:hypothetical protein